MEMPGFQESKLKKLGGTHYRTSRVVFNREEVLQKATPEVQGILEDLFNQIDYIELVINYYDLKVGKRKTQPRESLLKKFDEEQRQKCIQKAAELSQRQYLKMRHRLVELRTEQYTYKDCISNSIIPHFDNALYEEEVLRIGEDIEVLPMGLFDNSVYASKVFTSPPNPIAFTEEELKKVSDWIWKEKDKKNALDFENPEHLLALYRAYDELQSETEIDPNQIYNASAAIFKTLKFYEECARLNDLQREILQMKIEQKPNVEIASYINQKYKTTYNDNYISTIYRRKILPTIAEAATHHKLIMENIFYPEAFKKCKDCGKLFLRAPEFFMRQHKTPDGFSPRCKYCQRIKREKEKHKYEIKYVVSRADLENGTIRFCRVDEATGSTGNRSEQ